MLTICEPKNTLRITVLDEFLWMVNSSSFNSNYCIEMFLKTPCVFSQFLMFYVCYIIPMSSIEQTSLWWRLTSSYSDLPPSSQQPMDRTKSWEAHPWSWHISKCNNMQNHSCIYSRSIFIHVLYLRKLCYWLWDICISLTFVPVIKHFLFLGWFASSPQIFPFPFIL